MPGKEIDDKGGLKGRKPHESGTKFDVHLDGRHPHMRGPKEERGEYHTGSHHHDHHRGKK